MGKRNSQLKLARQGIIGFLCVVLLLGLGTSLWAMLYAQRDGAPLETRPWLAAMKRETLSRIGLVASPPSGKKYGMRALPSDFNQAQADASLQNIVDEFGQNANATWPGKLLRENELATRRTQEEASLTAHPAPSDRDRFGGDKSGPQLKAAGFFRTAMQGGRWWLVDPDGHLFFSVGMDAMDDGDAYHATVVTGREAMFHWLPSPRDPHGDQYGVAKISANPRPEGLTYNFYAANLERKYGSDYQAEWQHTALSRLQSWGFNTIGNWPDEALCRSHVVPYVARLGFPTTHAHVPTNYGGWGAIDDPYDPHFALDVASAMPRRVQAYKNDPYCIGYFIGNELTWTGVGPQARYGLAYGALSLSADSSPAKTAFLARLQSKYPGIQQLNAAWGTQIGSWQVLNAPWQVPDNPNAAMQADMGTFVHDIARKWFQIVDGELKKQDPQHLDLGCRFSHYTPEVAQACAEVCDVVSFNVYQPRVADADWGWLSGLHKPCLIGEFHSGALDRGMFWGGLVDAGSQAGRAAQYSAFLQSALNNPALVGCHWYAYIDEPVTGTLWDGENGNIGFVDVTDTPYPELVAAARQTNQAIYSARSSAP